MSYVGLCIWKDIIRELKGQSDKPLGAWLALRTSCLTEGRVVLLLFLGTCPCLWCRECVWRGRGGRWSGFDGRRRRILRGLTSFGPECRCLWPLSAWQPLHEWLIEGYEKSLGGLYGGSEGKVGW
jgi:hypothetical protein